MQPRRNREQNVHPECHWKLEVRKSRKSKVIPIIFIHSYRVYSGYLIQIVYLVIAEEEAVWRCFPESRVSRNLNQLTSVARPRTNTAARTLVSSVLMHHCLHIPEILVNISTPITVLANSRCWRELVTPSQVSKLIVVLFLAIRPQRRRTSPDLLWRDQVTFLPLIMCMPSDLWTIVEQMALRLRKDSEGLLLVARTLHLNVKTEALPGNPCVSFQTIRPLAEVDFSRVDFHAHRIRCLGGFMPVDRLPAQFVDQDLIHAFFERSQTKNLFPNPRNIDFEIEHTAICSRFAWTNRSKCQGSHLQ
jgi:hypothetical protein